MMRRRFLCILLLMILLPSFAFTEEPRPLASELILYVQNQLGNGYIWGASGQISTKNFRYGRAQVSPDAAELIFLWGDAWDGLPAFDCLGLFKAFAKQHSLNLGEDINTSLAWQNWTSDWGPLEGAILQPGMALFRIEGPRMSVQHVGVYIGNGKVIHARGTRWGVVEDVLPNVFTHWATFNWLDYDRHPDSSPVVTGPFLDVGSRAIIESSDAKPVTISPIPHEAGKLRESIGHFADGAILTVLAVPDEMSRLVEGTNTKGHTAKGYVRLSELREAPEQP